MTCRTSADLLAGVGQVDKAAAVNADARRRAPDDVKLTLQAANLAYLQGDDTSALAHARHAVQLAPDDSAAQLALGIITGEVVGGLYDPRSLGARPLAEPSRVEFSHSHRLL
jgi:Flp pilus assembly protein TadD